MKKCKCLLVLLAFLSLITLGSLSFAGGIEAPPDPWMVYIGVLGGDYSADFGYDATYFSNAARSEYFNNDAFQQGYSIGGQIGVEYHLHSPYFLGLVFAAMDDEDKARLASNNIDNGILPSGLTSQVNHLFRINYSLDIAFLFGIDITPFTQAYAKVGASCANFSDHFFTSRDQSFPFPTPFSQYTQNLNLWGWIFGLGLRHDISRWINLFVEYDYYAYGGQSLIDFNNTDPSSPLQDSLAQNVRINANAVLAGLNFKFMDSFYSMPRVQQNGSWMVYAGLLLGYYTADFGYGANYFSTASGGSNQIIANDVFQGGFSGGVQLGLQYHFRQPYFTGFSIGWMGNANKARLSNSINSNTNPTTVRAFDINNTFRISNNLDLAWIIGADITRWFHLYAKVGASYAQLKQELFTTGAGNVQFPTIFFLRNTSDNIWGFLLGFGLSHDVTKWLNVFAEYDHYFYANQDLASQNNIAPFFNPAAAGRDRLTQHVDVDASAIHFGVNFKFMDPYFVSMRQMVRSRRWMFYIGGFGGYYSANFIYGANYFTNQGFGGIPSNQTINNNAFQKGISGGGQVGIHYHFRRPYFIELAFSVASNGNKARLSVPLENAVTAGGVTNQTLINHFKISYNWDIAAIWGMDITSKTHLYAKVGASCAEFARRLTSIATNTIPFTLQQSLNESIWGWVFGAGLSHDLGKHLSIFAEGDHYSYSNRNLAARSDFAPFPTPAANILTQHIQIYGNTVRLGLNLTF